MTAPCFDSAACRAAFQTSVWITLLFLFSTCLGLLPISFAQTVQAGITYDGPNAHVIITARTTDDISAENLTGAIVTLRYPSGENTTLGTVTSTFGFAQQGSLQASGGFTYVVYTANPSDATLTTLNAANAEMELLRVAITQGANSANTIELAPRNTAPQLAGSDEFTFETNNVNFRDNVATPYFTNETTLPVELAAFRAVADGSQTIRLQWQTASETNNAGFDIERRLPDGAFASIAFVSGRGTQTAQATYSFEDTLLPFGANHLIYRLKQTDFDGSTSYSEAVEVTVGLPTTFALHGNFPNPFHTSTTIRYELPEAAYVELTVYDIQGRQRALLTQREQPAGRYSLAFDATNLSSGLYFYRLQAGETLLTHPMLLVK